MIQSPAVTQNADVLHLDPSMLRSLRILMKRGIAGAGAVPYCSAANLTRAKYEAFGKLRMPGLNPRQGESPWEQSGRQCSHHQSRRCPVMTVTCSAAACLRLGCP